MGNRLSLLDNFQKRNSTVYELYWDKKINFKTKDKGTTIFHIACQNGDLEIVRKFIENGALINITDKKDTPLHLACIKGHTEIVELLLKSGAIPNSPNKGMTPLHCATWSKHSKVVNLLLEHLEDIDHLNNKNTALQIASWNGDHKITEVLVRKIKNINNQNKGNSAIHLALYSSSPKCVELILSTNCSSNQPNNNIYPLHLAAQKGFSKLIDKLILNGSYIDSVDNNQTALHFACEKGYLKCVKKLISHKANVNHLNNKQTPLEVTILNGFTAIVSELLNNGAEVNVQHTGSYPLHLACNKGNIEVIELLLKRNADITCVDNGNTPLHIASKNGHSQILEYLIKQSTSVDPKNKGLTPLHVACLHGRLQCVSGLLSGGADLNITCEQAKPVEIADKKEYSEIVRLIHAFENRHIIGNKLQKYSSAKPKIKENIEKIGRMSSLVSLNELWDWKKDYIEKQQEIKEKQEKERQEKEEKEKERQEKEKQEMKKKQKEKLELRHFSMQDIMTLYGEDMNIGMNKNEEIDEKSKRITKFLEETFKDVLIEENEIKLGRSLGQGMYGVVRYGTWKKTEVAITIFKLQELKADELNKFIDKVKLNYKINNVNITKFYGVVVKYPEFWHVSQYYTKGSLFRMIYFDHKEYTLMEKIKMVLEIAQGIYYLHSKNIIHQVIRSKNILIDRNGRTKIGNFGMLTFYRASREGFLNSVGQPYWLAPEILQTQDFSFSADIFSFGMLLYEISTMKLPYGNDSPFQVISNIINGVRPQILPDNPFKDIIASCWDFDPQKRPTIKQVLSSLLVLQTKLKNQNHEEIHFDVN
ncbi:ankyrin repeat-containing protein [Anaeramoeba ignava]|uniref:Ankyrin repeat-containing protein n=1 Tax=Anaeramoeba ignava TaxID=1746090 RepID=A0A9Q0LKH4_ANAIG|nr:ankyrin repeat-containing protein [Anaeramoeba ignava]